MSHTLIKICGIRDPLIATACARAGADFIGIVFHPDSPRYVDVTQATAIADAAKKSGVIPVAVFTDQNTETMLKICQITGINTVQLHGKNARQSHHLLPKDFHRIYVRTVNSIGTILNDDEENMKNLNVTGDYLLFDNEKGGSGMTFGWSGFHYAGPFRWFLSGGLTPDNVISGIEQLMPTAVDVSSGVEKSPGQKDIRLIEEFIARIKKGAK
jgi:phosphoribosylanthranilate isomerase